MPPAAERPIGAGADRTLSFPIDPSTAEGAHERTALVHLPTGYRPDSPHPVLLVYHGHGGNSADAAASTGFRELADREGFLAVYPQGLRVAADFALIAAAVNLARLATLGLTTPPAAAGRSTPPVDHKPRPVPPGKRTEGPASPSNGDPNPSNQRTEPTPPTR